MLTEPTDTSPTPNELMSPDEQSARSRRYGNAVVVLLPLDSGRIAILDRTFALRQMCDDLPSHEELRTLATQFETELSLRSKLAHDLKTARKLPARVAPRSLAIEIDL